MMILDSSLLLWATLYTMVSLYSNS